MTFRLLLRTCCIAAAAAAPLSAVAVEAVDVASTAWADPATSPAEIMPLAASSLMLDVARSGSHYVAVGARGDVLLSDNGRQWRQVEVPTRSTLTAVTALDAQVWVVGHDGVILHSDDAGEHWQMQRKDPWLPSGVAEAARDPKQGAPLLDVLFLDPKHGFAIGAYSLALTTDDGGETWKPMTVVAKADAAKADAAQAADDAPAADAPAGAQKETFSAAELKLGEEPTPHLNAITRTGSGALFIVAERGSAFRSRDNGATWKRLQLPYDGSMFGVLGYEGDHVLTFGLRGHAYESTDLGGHWTEVATGTELSLLGGVALADGGAVIAGVNGIVLIRGNSTEPLHGFVSQSAGIIATALPLGGGPALLLAGENGISSFEPN